MQNYVLNLADIENVARIVHAARCPDVPWDDLAEPDRVVLELGVTTIVDNAANQKVVHPPDVDELRPLVMAAMRAIVEAADNLLEHLNP